MWAMSGSRRSGSVLNGMKAVETMSRGSSTPWMSPAIWTGCLERRASPEKTSTSTSPIAKATRNAKASPDQLAGSAPHSSPRAITVHRERIERIRSQIMRPMITLRTWTGIARTRARSPDSTSTAKAIADPPAVNMTAGNMAAAMRKRA